MKFVLTLYLVFIIEVNCQCGLFGRKPKRIQELKEEYLDLVHSRDGKLDKPLSRPLCIEEEQILWSFRGSLVAMPETLRSAILIAHKKGLSWSSYETQAKVYNMKISSMHTAQCGLLGRRKKSPAQLMNEYLDLVIVNQGKLIRPPCRPFCIDEEQIMWLFRKKLETVPIQLKSDVLDARRNKRSWIQLLRSERKTSKQQNIVTKKREENQILEKLLLMMNNAKSKRNTKTVTLQAKTEINLLNINTTSQNMDRIETKFTTIPISTQAVTVTTIPSAVSTTTPISTTVPITIFATNPATITPIVTTAVSTNKTATTPRISPTSFRRLDTATSKKPCFENFYDLEKNTVDLPEKEPKCTE